MRRRPGVPGFPRVVHSRGELASAFALAFAEARTDVRALIVGKTIGDRGGTDRREHEGEVAVEDEVKLLDSHESADVASLRRFYSEAVKGAGARLSHEIKSIAGIILRVQIDLGYIKEDLGKQDKN